MKERESESGKFGYIDDDTKKMDESNDTIGREEENLGPERAIKKSAVNWCKGDDYEKCKRL